MFTSPSWKWPTGAIAVIAGGAPAVSSVACSSMSRRFTWTEYDVEPSTRTTSALAPANWNAATVPPIIRSATWHAVGGARTDAVAVMRIVRASRTYPKHVAAYPKRAIATATNVSSDAIAT